MTAYMARLGDRRELLTDGGDERIDQWLGRLRRHIRNLAVTGAGRNASQTDSNSRRNRAHPLCLRRVKKHRSGRDDPNFTSLVSSGPSSRGATAEFTGKSR